VWKANNNHGRILESETKEKQIVEECAFKLKINHSMNEEEISKIRVDGDYIYRKNLSWLQKVKEKNKVMELEGEINRAKDNIHIKRSASKRSLREGRSKPEARILKQDSNANNESSFGNNDPLLTKLTNIDKDINEMKEMFMSLKSIYDENKTVTEVINESKVAKDQGNNVLSRNNCVKKSYTNNPPKPKDDFAYLDKYQMAVEKDIMKYRIEEVKEVHDACKENGSVDYS